MTTTLRILELLAEEKTGMTRGELGAEIGVWPNAINSAVTKLLDKKLIAGAEKTDRGQRFVIHPRLGAK
jgi:DNA-binding Lrp family transcriptional regulator